MVTLSFFQHSCGPPQFLKYTYISRETHTIFIVHTLFNQLVNRYPFDMSIQFTNLSNYGTLTDSQSESDDMEILGDVKKVKGKRKCSLKSVAESEEETEDDEIFDSDEDTEDDKKIENGLSKEPLSEAWRTIFTINGITINVEMGTCKSDWPQCNINIGSWSTLGMISQFDNTLQRFGLEHGDFCAF